jgi:uncharacterized protein YecE (DUF72 family)
LFSLSLFQNFVSIWPQRFPVLNEFKIDNLTYVRYYQESQTVTNQAGVCPAAYYCFLKLRNKMADIKTGTSGYDYLDWVNNFYPQSISRKKFLYYYSNNFSTVELNFTYYRLPQKTQIETFIKNSNPDMDFSIKGHESMTHRPNPATWKTNIQAYIQAVTPLLQSNRLAAVLLQFPYRFHYEKDNRLYLDKLLRELQELPLVVEFRNPHWLNRRTFEGLRQREVGFCITDAPRIKGVPPTIDITTSKLAYIRFHGRNAQNWWDGNASSRFDYLYSQKELSSWISRLKTLVKTAQKIRIYFNNHRKGQAPTNAQMLKNILEKAKITP